MELPQNIFNIIFPVGVYYFTEGEDPQSIFSSMGISSSWVKVEGRFLLGTSSKYVLNSEGGEETHTLTIEEMPAHDHRYYQKSTGSDIPSGAANWGGGSVAHDTSSTGGSQSHNNMPPYRAVNIWRRTA